MATIPPEEKPECFVIMPIADCDGYVAGHFKRVYDDIIKIACEKAGYKAIRADDVKESNLIHLDILQRLLESPMAVCDLSSTNPNVLFELALRQAFDKPVVLIQEVGTRSIFDIAPLRYTEYRRDRIYHEVLSDQRQIADSIIATREAFKKGTGINSIVKLLGLSQAASLPVPTGEARKEEMMELIFAELGAVRREVRSLALPQPEAEVRRLHLINIRSRFNELWAEARAFPAGPEMDEEKRDLASKMESFAIQLASLAVTNEDRAHAQASLSQTRLFLRSIGAKEESGPLRPVAVDLKDSFRG